MSNYKNYFLKSLGLQEDQIPGGVGDDTNSVQVDPEQLEMGIKVEMEHTYDRDLAKEIALDHLTEDPQYYSRLKDAGLSDEVSSKPSKPNIPMMQKLLSPSAIMSPSVIAVGIRGTRTGLLPAGGIVDDPEKARLGGLELVKNLKPNSQGAIANTPEPEVIKADGGHFTPENIEITKGTAPITNVSGDDVIHPMQVQQLGNKPFEDDGTTRDGKHTPEAAGGYDNMSDDDISMDITKILRELKEVQDEMPIKNRFKELANIQSDEYSIKNEAGLISEKIEKLRSEVNLMKRKGKKSPILEKAVKYLEEVDNKEFDKIWEDNNFPTNESTIQEFDKPGDEAWKRSENIKTNNLDELIKLMILIKDPEDTPESVADAISIKAKKDGIAITQSPDYILSKVIENWKR